MSGSRFALCVSLFVWITCAGCPGGQETPAGTTPPASTSTAGPSATPAAPTDTPPGETTSPGGSTPHPSETPGDGTATPPGPSATPPGPSATPPGPSVTPGEGSATPPGPSATPLGPTPTPTAPCGEGCVFTPPDPAEVAPPADPRALSAFAEAVSFIYQGPDAIQRGVEEGAIEAPQLAILRGRILDRGGDALAGVRVGVLDHPELGHTFSRADGRYDLAVGGGGWVVLSYQLEGYARAQRRVRPAWEAFVTVPDLRLVAYDPAVTHVDFSEALQIARGSPVEDEDGARQATLLIPADAGAAMILADGSEVELASMAVRATEYTVGPGGPQAMPGPLPATSGYTYAVELSVDEAVEAGAAQVRFEEPVIFYLEDFLDFPVGGAVPAGHYDFARASWIPSANGRVVEVLSVDGDLAVLDVDGAGEAASPQALAALGVTAAERQRLAQLYLPGQRLWRVPIPHFSPWDCNWPYGPGGGAAPPGGSIGRQSGGSSNSSDAPCPEQGSIIECQSRVLGERIELVGVEGSLNHRANRTPGWRAGRTLEVPLLEDSWADSLRRVTVEISLADHLDEAEYTPSAGLIHTWTWDGTVFGQPWQGVQEAHIRVGYVYPAAYLEPAEMAAAFGQYPSGIQVIADRQAGEITLVASYEVPVESWGPELWSVGGWSLSMHHVYSAATQTLYYGDGRRRPGTRLVRELRAVAGQPDSRNQDAGDGGPASEALLKHPAGLVVAPDGAVIIADESAQRVRRVGPDGIITTLAGTGVAGLAGDGGPATAALLHSPRDLAMDAEGRLYIADYQNHRIRRVDLDGTIHTVAGNGAWEFSGDGGPATQAALRYPKSVAVDGAGNLYIADSTNNRVRRVSPDGVITTVAGDGSSHLGPGNATGDGGLATEVPVPDPDSVAVDGEGNLYVSSFSRIRKVTPDGIITAFAGTGVRAGVVDGIPATEAWLNSPDGMEVDSEGNMFIADWGNARIRQVSPDGIITTLAGIGTGGYEGVGGPATQAQLLQPGDVALHPGGDLLLTTGHYVARITAPQVGSQMGETFVPSEDGHQVFVFDAGGRHLRTADALTGVSLYTFAYDEEGRLLAVTDRDGRVIRVERSGAGVPTAIVGPDGQVTALEVGADGYLSSVTSPAGERHVIGYHAGGIVRTFTDPRGGTSTYAYDPLGRLRSAEDAVGAVQSLSRVDAGSDAMEIVHESGEGWETTHRAAYEDGGAVIVRQVESPLGVEVTTATSSGGAVKVIDAADGTHNEITLGPDPRFGMGSPLQVAFSSAAPSGLVASATFDRTVALQDPADVLSLISQTDRLTVNERVYQSTWDRAAGHFERLSPEGRLRQGFVDEVGRLVEMEVDPAVEPALYAYDDQGRIQTFSHGDMAAFVTRDAEGFVGSIEDAAGRTTRYERDDAGRITRLILPSGRTFDFAYDSGGNRVEVIMPSGEAHTQGYTAVNLPASYTPPGGGGQQVGYNLDRQRTQLTLASGVTVEYAYEGGQRLAGITYGDTDIDLEYDGSASLRPRAMVRREDSGSPYVLGFSWDGSLLTGLAQEGAVSAGFTYRYDANFFLVGVTLDGTPELSLPRDGDGLLIGQGPFSIEREGPAGSPSLISGGGHTQTLTYDALGRYAGGVHGVDGAAFYELSLERDASGRLAERVEILGDERRDEAFVYDPDGQLLEVWRGGARAERYTYDDNGNRASRQLGDGPTEGASYDPQDRLLTLGGVAYTFDADGHLAGRGEDRFDYSARGELLQATLAGGAVIRYRYDALSRPVEREVGGEVTTWLYGNPTQPYQLTASLDPEGALTRYLYDEAGRLFAFERGGAWYAVASDAVGSPRVVVDAEGQVVKRVDRDAFGAVLADSAPGFSLDVGFAGGLYDAQTGLVRFGLRDYDPQAGRWTARDPILFEGAQANLYVYVGNDPLLQRDPLGLFCVGASLYSGFGGGASFCWTDKGMSICGEVGVGVGGGVTADPWGELEETRRKVSAQASYSTGVASVGVGGEISYGPCGFDYGASVDASIGIGPASVGASVDLRTGEVSPTGALSGSLDSHVKSSGKLGVGVEASVSVGACARF